MKVYPTIELTVAGKVTIYEREFYGKYKESIVVLQPLERQTSLLFSDFQSTTINQIYFTKNAFQFQLTETEMAEVEVYISDSVFRDVPSWTRAKYIHDFMKEHSPWLFTYGVRKRSIVKPKGELP